MEIGEWRLGIGDWGLETGDWGVESEGWRMEDGGWKLEIGCIVLSPIYRWNQNVEELRLKTNRTIKRYSESFKIQVVRANEAGNSMTEFRKKDGIVP